jgi:hypothetical protein
MDRASALFHDESNFLDHGLAGYRRYFSDAAERRPDAEILFEATPGYMYQQTALEALPKLPGEPRFLFQLRQPSAQVYSNYLYSLHRAGNLPQATSFREFALGSEATSRSTNEFHREALLHAEYVRFLDRWQAAGGAERMRVTRFEDLRDGPREYMRDLATWLSIDPDFYDDYEFQVVNRNVAVKARSAQTLARRLSGPLRGRAREVAKDLYRRLNTRSAAGPSTDDVAVMEEIDRRMQTVNGELAGRFGVDVRSWSTH